MTNDDLNLALRQLDPVTDVQVDELNHESATAQRIHQRALHQATPTSPRQAGRPRRRRMVLLGATLVLVLGLGAWLSPWPSDVPGLDCHGFFSIEQQVATHQLDDGTRYELWTTQRGVDAPVNGEMLIQKRPDGSTAGWSLGCSGPDEVVKVTDPLTAISYGGGTVHVDTRTGTTETYGPAPARTSVVVVTFSDGVVVEADVSSMNYWLVVRELENIAYDDDIDDFILPQPVNITAVGPDGEVIDTHDILLDEPAGENMPAVPN